MDVHLFGKISFLKLKLLVKIKREFTSPVLMDIKFDNLKFLYPIKPLSIDSKKSTSKNDSKIISALKLEDGTFLVVEGSSDILRKAKLYADQNSVISGINVYETNQDLLKLTKEIQLAQKDELYDINFNGDWIKDILKIGNVKDENLDFLISELRPIYEKLKNGPRSKNNLKQLYTVGEKIRYFQNIKIWKRKKYQDAIEEGFTVKELQLMWRKLVPLGFNQENFPKAMKELEDALRKEGLTDAVVMLKGTSTTFYSRNPDKKLGKHFKVASSDYDFNIYSDILASKMKEHGLENFIRPGSYRSKWITHYFPALFDFTRKWSDITGHEVTVIGKDADPSLDIPRMKKFAFSL